MDSLLASYASSSDEEIDEKSSSELGTNKASISPSLSSFLPQPKFLNSNPNPDLNEPTKGSIFSSFPAKKSTNSTNPLRFDQKDDSYEDIEGESSKGSLFSSLPTVKSDNSANILDLESIFDRTNSKNEKKPPKGLISSSIPAPKSKRSTNPLGLDLNPKKVVRFTPPVNPNLQKYDDEEEEEREKEKAIINPSFNASSSFSSMLPAPKNTLCLAPQSNSSNFSSRKSSLNTQLPTINTPQIEEPTHFEPYQTYDNSVPVQTGTETVLSYTESGATLETSSAGYINDYAGYKEYSYNKESSNYSNNAMINDLGREKGKRGRNEMPAEIMEVKQDELMKNRPKQDPRKLTCLAFGPSYQPAPSEKGKTSKLHKRKHQIGTLYQDMKSKEMELAERRSKGFLTKAETQAKYGW
ncbi:hypothetical protein LUZ60_008937 [Juncus effusus]|nr:hypothetical protein LUZ60_008937 [Juncus effusus]